MQIYSVSEFIKGINTLLGDIPVCVQGEVSGFKVTQNRFVWFDLKDDKSVVSNFLLAFQLQQPLEDGMLVQVTGHPALFTKSGRFHLRVQTITVVGEGSLRRQYELLKTQLTTEGLFDAERKRALPRFPQRIGLVTSGDAAAFTDVQRILHNRWAGLDIVHFPVQVQGEQAVSSIVQALQLINQAWAKKLDVVIVTRGGGSLEDLQAFNAEAVVRAIFALRVPCVVGVGHERDETLAEYVADVRASTPSNAAELVVPHKQDVLYQISTLLQQQEQTLQSHIQDEEQQIAAAIDVLSTQAYRYSTTIQTVYQNFILQTERWHNQVKLQHAQVDHFEQLLQSYNPQQILERGYSITTSTTGKVITSAAQVKMEQDIITTLRDGKIKSRVL